MSGKIHSRQDSKKIIIKEDRSVICIVFVCVATLSGFCVFILENVLCKLATIIGQ